MTRLSLRALAPLGLTLALVAGAAVPRTAVLASRVSAKPPPTPAAPVVTGSLAAIINGHRVPIGMYRLLLTVDHRSNPTMPIATLVKSVKQEIIYDELIREYAATHGIHVAAADLAKQEQQDAAGVGGLQKFTQLLKQRYGITLAQYRELIAPNILAQKVEQRVTPVKGLLTDAQAKALAQRLLNQLRHGANFAALARKYSQDPGSAARGGDLGEIRPNQTVPPFNYAVFHAKLKTYVLVHSTFGYHIVEVLSRGKAAPAGQPKGAKVLEAHVRHILISTQASQTQQTQQRQRFLAWLQTQQKHAKVTWLAKTKGA